MKITVISRATIGMPDFLMRFEAGGRAMPKLQGDCNGRRQILPRVRRTAERLEYRSALVQSGSDLS
jgi:hypothetical protein